MGHGNSNRETKTTYTKQKKRDNREILRIQKNTQKRNTQGKVLMT